MRLSKKVLPPAQDESMRLVSLDPFRSDVAAIGEKSSRTPTRFEPFILRKFVGVGLVLFLVFLAATVQVLNVVINYHFHGVGPVRGAANGDKLTQYLWAAPTFSMTIISVCVTAAVGSVDFSLKRIEPYRQLGHGNAAADSSLLLEYLGVSQIFVWRRAFANGHWIVVLSSLACLISLVLSPISSTLFTTRPAFKVQDFPITLRQSFGLPFQWDALVQSYGAANAVSSFFLSNASYPAYANSEWAVTAFDLGGTVHAGLSSNATLNGILPSIKSYANCEDTDIQWSARNSDFTFDATITGKESGNQIIQVGFNAWGRTQFNATVMPLNGQTDPRFQSFVYQIFTPLTEDITQQNNVGHPNMSVTICNPTSQAQDTVVSLDSMSRSLLSAQSAAQSAATNLSFLNGNAAFNGFYFNVSEYGPIVAQRKESTMFGLVSVMYQVALDHPGGIPQTYADNIHYNITKNVYQHYLTLMALNNYLTSATPANADSAPIVMTSTTLQNLLYVSTFSATIISATLVVIASLVLTALVLHWRTFNKIGLRVNPATIAGTGMTMVGGDIARLLSDPDTTNREMKAALRKYRWSLIDGKVCATDGLIR